MHTAQVTRTIHAPVDRVWDAFDDFNNIANFSPLVEHSPTTNGVERGVGAKRECTFYSGGAIKEVVLESEPERHQKIQIYEMGPFPLKEAVADINFVPRGENTDVTFAMNFAPKFGPLGWLMGKTVMKSQFAKTLDQLLHSLDEHLRTGKKVGKNGVLVAD